jgi:hypothetical protein
MRPLNDLGQVGFAHAFEEDVARQIENPVRDSGAVLARIEHSPGADSDLIFVRVVPAQAVRPDPPDELTATRFAHPHRAATTTTPPGPTFTPHSTPSRPISC